MRSAPFLPLLAVVFIAAGCTHLPETNPNIDVALSAATSSPAAPQDGDPLTLSFTILNSSAAGHTLTDIPWAVRRDDASGFRTGTIASLAPRASSDQSVTFVESGGSHTYAIQVAGGNPYGEANIGNNQRFLLISVTGTPAALDLSFSGTPAIAPHAPNTLQQLTLTFTVKDTSASNTAASDVRYSVARDGVANFKTGSIPSIPANATRDGIVTFTEATAGNHTYTMRIDPQNAIRETDETNNLFTLAATIAPAAVASR